MKKSLKKLMNARKARQDKMVRQSSFREFITRNPDTMIR